MAQLPDPMTMAKADGYTSAYGCRTWDSLIQDFYQQLPEQSLESEVTAELDHVLMMTGEAESAMDPTLSPSLNRVV
jgi:hypothetical protein